MKVVNLQLVMGVRKKINHCSSDNFIKTADKPDQPVDGFFNTRPIEIFCQFLQPMANFKLVFIIISIVLSVLSAEEPASSSTLEELRQKITENPNNSRAYQALGEKYYENHDFEKAVNQFWEILRLDPGNALAHLWLGKCYLKRGIFDRAIYELQTAIESDDALLDAYIVLGEHYLDQQDFSKALLVYEKAYGLDEESIMIRLGLAKCYEKTGNLEKAKQLYDQLKEVKDVSGAVATALGQIHWSEGNFSKAKTYYLEAVQQGVVDTNVYNKLGQIYFKEHDWDQAVLYFQHTLKISPVDLEARLALAESYLELGNVEQAIEHLKVVVNKDKRNYLAYSKLGLAYAKLGQTQKASEHLNEAIRLSPKDKQLRLMYGEYLLEIKECDQALLTFEKILKSDPNTVKAQLGIAKSLWKKKQEQDAITYLEEQMPDNEVIFDLLDLLVNYLFLSQQFDEAEIRAKNGIDHFPEQGQFYYHLARIYFEKKDWSNAKTYAETCLAKHYSQPQCHFILGEYFKAQNQLEEAKKEYLEALKLSESDSPFFERVSQAIKDMDGKVPTI